ncbi:MAG: hypothetical protein WED82_01860 [Balneolales bacterium]
MTLTEEHINYLAQLHSGQWFGFDGEQTYENLWVKGHDKPTQQQIEDGTEQMLFQQKARSVDSQRRKAYQNESDPLFLKWQRGEATEQEWLDKIQEIKERFPKP